MVITKQLSRGNRDERSFIFLRLVNKSFRRANMVKEEYGIWSILLRKVCACKTDLYDLLFREWDLAERCNFTVEDWEQYFAKKIVKEVKFVTAGVSKTAKLVLKWRNCSCFILVRTTEIHMRLKTKIALQSIRLHFYRKLIVFPLPVARGVL